MSKRQKRTKQYVDKLMEMHSNTFQNAVKRHSNGSTTFYSGKRQAKKMAKLGMALERF